MFEHDRHDCFQKASSFLPVWLRCAVRTLPERQKEEAEEFRLRAGRPPAVAYPDGEWPVAGCESRAVTPEDLVSILELASQGSAHTVLERWKNGYVTVGGGHRLGICGSGVVKDGTIANINYISSLSIRIAKQVPGAASGMIKDLLHQGALQSTLILSPPGRGKTTLLREIIRCVSDGVDVPPMRVGVVDERGELAAAEAGLPHMDLGARTDVMDGCPKQIGLLMLLRGMNPQVLAVDEITAPEDVDALLTAAGCGVTLLATAHGEGVSELRTRPVYRRLLDENIFKRVVVISMDGKKRSYRVLPVGTSV